MCKKSHANINHLFYVSQNADKTRNFIKMFHRKWTKHFRNSSELYIQICYEQNKPFCYKQHGKLQDSSTDKMDDLLLSWPPWWPTQNYRSFQKWFTIMNYTYKNLGSVYLIHFLFSLKFPLYYSTSSIST